METIQARLFYKACHQTILKVLRISGEGLLISIHVSITFQHKSKNINVPWNKILPVAAPEGLEVSWISETDPVIDLSLSPVLAVTYQGNMDKVEKQEDRGPDYGHSHMGIQGYSILVHPLPNPTSNTEITEI